jgi:hypothetical protein
MVGDRNIAIPAFISRLDCQSKGSRLHIDYPALSLNVCIR